MQAIYEKWIWMWIIVCFCGCSDDALQDTLLKVSAPPAMTGVPIEIQELLWDDPEEEKEKLRLILQHPDDHPDWLPNIYRIRVCLSEQQRLYYTKYIDAEGIAIMGNSDVTDAEFWIARDITLRMTAKCPQLRKMMSPASRYKTILLSYPESQTIGDIPEYTCRNDKPRSPFGIGGRFKSVTLKKENAYWRTFVHEFAHAIEAFITCYENKTRYCYYESGVTLQTLDFQNRLETAYAQAIALGTWKGRYAETNYREYWAEGVRMWYYDIGTGREFETHEDFARHDPLIAELLAEWFARDTF